MYKTQIKHKFKIGENVIITDYPYRGCYKMATVTDIRIKVHKHSIDIRYVLNNSYDSYDFSEDTLEKVEEFNKRKRAESKGYDDYLRWLSHHDFTKHDF